jgi:hypothetical protein
MPDAEKATYSNSTPCLSLIDALRVGRVREQRLAASELEKRLVTL